MKKYNLKDFKRGWFIGNFSPALLNTENFEVAIKFYKKGDYEEMHYHKKCVEYTVIVKGKVKMFNMIFKKGDIIQVNPYDKTSFTSLSSTITAVIKTPSVKNDKFIEK